MSLGEFTEVGDTIEEFSSDNATIVVGTVIDESMTDELRVTVVATGLGDATQETAPKKVVDNTVNKADGSVDYKKLDRPTVMRGSNTQPAQQAAPENKENKDMDYLDIPAFLRRQAD